MLAMERKITKKIADEAMADSHDLFSKLSDDLIHHIVSFLAPKDLINTRVLARRWLSFSPVLYFKHRPFPLAENYQENVITDAFCHHFTSEALQSFSKKMATIRSVSIEIQSDLNMIGQCINDLVSLALRNNVYEFELRVRGPWYCQVPQTIFSSESLHVLQLDGCSLKFTCHMTGRLDALRVLRLSYVDFLESDLVQITSISPNITDFSMRRCSGTLQHGSLVLSNFKKLKNVQLHVIDEPWFDKLWIEMDAPNLRSFNLATQTQWRTCKIVLQGCRKLEILKLNISDDLHISFLEELLNRNPLLKYISVVELQGLDLFKLARSDFKTFHFWKTATPRNKMKIEAEEEQEVVSVSTYGFHKLRAITEKFRPSWLLSFPAHGWKLKKEAVEVEELRKICVSPLCRIKHLKLELTNAGPFPLRYSKLLVDALLCCSYPETLTLKLNKHQNICAEVSSEELKLRGEKWKKCCEGTDLRCWRHFLKEVQVEHSTRTNKQGTED